MPGTSNAILDFLFFKHFEVTSLILILLIAGAQKLYSLARIKEHPELKEGYPKVIYGFLAFLGIPNLIAVIAVWIFGYPGANFFKPTLQSNTIISLLGNVLLIFEALLLFVWVWLFGGAEYLHKYQLLLFNFRSPLAAKLFTAAIAVWALIMFWILVF